MLLSSLILLPIATALLVLLAPRGLAKPLALLGALGTLALCGPLYTGFNPAAAGLQFTESYAWLPSLDISFSLGIDGIALALLLLNNLLTPLVVLAAWREERNSGAFMACLLGLAGLVNGVFAATDFILFYVFFEASLIPLYLLIGLWGGNQRVYAALKFFLYTFAGSVLMLVAGLYLGTQAGTFDFTQWGATAQALPLAAQVVLFGAFLAAFAVKIPMWPLHTWLPDAHVQAPTAGSVILAGVLLKLGAYGLLRFNLPLFPEAVTLLAPYLLWAGAIAVVYAALVAWVQTDIKKLIAYSSVSHMGVVTMGLFSGTETGLHGALLIMINHGIVSAGLFLIIGVMYERLHTREMKNLGGLAAMMPAYAFALVVLMLAAVALPGTNGFVGEFLGLAGSFPSSPWATALATTGVIFGAVYMLVFTRAILFQAPSRFVTDHRAACTDLSVREWGVFLPLLVLIPLLGVKPHLAMDLWRVPVEALTASRVIQSEAKNRATREQRLRNPGLDEIGASVSVNLISTTLTVSPS
jgi:NADH-quinone oxidoreductase subunit M